MDQRIQPARTRAFPLARTLRQIHYWASVFLIVTILVVSVSGTLLLLKKDFDALQPPVAAGTAPGLSDLPLRSLLTEIRRIDGHEQTSWRDVDRIDVEPADGIAKVILASRTEFQVDLQTGAVLQTGYRTSDLLESIHDFTFVGPYGKYLIALPSGIALFLMWLTGTYLFLLPFLARRRKRRRGN
jgi:uncharacterized iron-regulated membrane protein